MAYFQEPVVENPNENYRVRKCTVYYYLEDDTLHINEKRVENSGITQGVFLKRHQVPKPDGSGNYSYKDLNLGMNIDVYGRVFRVFDCFNDIDQMRVCIKAVRDAGKVAEVRRDKRLRERERLYSCFSPV